MAQDSIIRECIDNVLLYKIMYCSTKKSILIYFASTLLLLFFFLLSVALPVFFECPRHPLVCLYRCWNGEWNREQKGVKKTATPVASTHLPSLLLKLLLSKAGPHNLSIVTIEPKSQQAAQHVICHRQH